ncbi:hypothetical protein [Streptomyces piniterrae]|uniref:hypothetical protein n=1 Tax=Streptomyces piniterrae TaxID=2571125 RepID=UPI001FEB00D1|nr:hypothetical protein [Streptomyces piniterrae]
MTQMNVPQQPGEAEGDPQRLHKAPAGRAEDPGPLPVTPPGASEATRLLCAGTYMDDKFRDTVIDELYVHEERFAAPSLGIDAARVLAHALRARRLELGWAAGILLLWIVAVPMSGGLALGYLFPVILIALSRAVLRAPIPWWWARLAAFLMRWYGRLSLLGFVVTLVITVCGGEVGVRAATWPLSLLMPDSWTGGMPDFGSYDDSGWDSAPMDTAYASGTDHGTELLRAWIALALPLLLATMVALQRGQFALALARELSRERFPDAMSDPAERSEGFRFRRLRDRVRTEQHGPLVMYGSANPFCGAGRPYKTWSLEVELRPRDDREVQPMDNRAILDRVVPLVAALRVPSPHGSPEAAAAVRDRLRALEIDECVFLPAEGLKSRTTAPYAPEASVRHLADAVEEGGETRRHFLRIRVGGWNEGVVTTVFVRVHTQGGMLMLEVAPHVLWPLRQLFQDADRIAHHYRHHNHFGKAVWALARAPRSAGGAVTTLVRGLLSSWRLATGGHGGALPDGPGASVRELGSFGEASLFQEMDVARYLKTIQQRVAAGVTTALHDAGYETDEFEQRVIHVAQGGVYVESAQGAVGIGDNNTITNNANNANTANVTNPSPSPSPNRNPNSRPHPHPHPHPGRTTQPGSASRGSTQRGNG